MVVAAGLSRKFVTEQTIAKITVMRIRQNVVSIVKLPKILHSIETLVKTGVAFNEAGPVR